MKKIILSALIIGFLLITPSFATSLDISSLSIGELKELVAKINNRIHEIEKSQKACFVSSLELSVGDGEGEDKLQEVKRLQDFLKEKGYLSAKSTGYFGKLTRGALISYQAKSGLPQTGEFDEMTRKIAHSAICNNSAISGKSGEEWMKYEKEKWTKIEAQKKEYEKEYEKKTYSDTQTSTVGSISATVYNNIVTWTTSAYAKNGFKVVWSKTSGPTYPPRSVDRAQYYEAGKTKAEWLEAFDGTGEYYVRVCEYLNGSCGVYSNEVKVYLQK